jgi:hypothetical protein
MEFRFLIPGQLFRIITSSLSSSSLGLAFFEKGCGGVSMFLSAE